MNLYKKCIEKITYESSFLVTDATLSSANPIRVTKNILERT